MNWSDETNHVIIAGTASISLSFDGNRHALISAAPIKTQNGKINALLLKGLFQTHKNSWHWELLQFTFLANLNLVARGSV